MSVYSHNGNTDNQEQTEIKYVDNLSRIKSVLGHQKYCDLRFITEWRGVVDEYLAQNMFKAKYPDFTVTHLSQEILCAILDSTFADFYNAKEDYKSSILYFNISESTEVN